MIQEKYYFLEDGELQAVNSLEEYGKRTKINDENKTSFDAHKRVAETTLKDGTWVSTVCLMTNHNWGDGPPLIFETMAFASKDNLLESLCERYSTLEEAQEGHDRIVARLSKEIK